MVAAVPVVFPALRRRIFHLSLSKVFEFSELKIHKNEKMIAPWMLFRHPQFSMFSSLLCDLSLKSKGGQCGACAPSALFSAIPT
jgi:hypothetical protein